ncbi:Antitoxin VapB1 [Methylobacterium mesophilicum]|uniref:antitoxin n=1 Tax=unclassified Methylobacterium TaxID=2615210 RepID=UPI0011CBF3E3|nr:MULTISPECIES: AbrB/MazE/SpoVT family DNA-binding domain-containing protein [Methylobacterium]TXN47738.1 AbrB/MazE/SpoVT family DNA-binding domain-containing protein [Methylobacterium sp. WL7]TXN63875.1 AbrB/MazE/SpoVT family DNA-binding domain-containing protein [Methylobacterium sp. WL18]GJE22572.1 Antitoxin VapB1 [Methylobacterium mesophilicum]
MRRTRVFQSGNSQAVRLPAGFRLQGPEIEILRRGDEIVLREIRTHDLTAAFALLTELPIDELVREDAPPQDRDGL